VPRAAAAALLAAEQLRDDRLETFRQHGADLRLFVRRKGVDHAVHGFRRVVGVHGGEHQHSHRGAGEPEPHGVVFAHLADQHDIGVRTHRAAQRDRERCRLEADFAVDDRAVLVLVHEFDRVLDGDDVLAEIGVDVVDHRGQRGRFAGTGRPGDQHQARFQRADVLEHIRHVKVFESQDLGRNLAHDAAHSVVVVHVVGSETRQSGNFVCEVEVMGFHELVPTLGHADLLEHLLHIFRCDHFIVQRDDIAVHTGLGRKVDRQMQVGAAELEHLPQVLIDDRFCFHI